jgi:soluble lytic murein transglycosylase-like protein
VSSKLNDRIGKRGSTIAAIAAIGALAGGGATAIAADSPAEGVPVLDGKTTLDHTIQAQASREEYRKAYADAKRLHVAPKRDLSRAVAHPSELKTRAVVLRTEVKGEQARRAAKEKKEARQDRGSTSGSGGYGTPESVGVDQGTLDAIASCESGGDPTAVDPSGTYRGKYQFDLGTWASVGGSGDPAAAPEAEQDYRAALLMSQAGSSPWPVCGS